MIRKRSVVATPIRSHAFAVTAAVGMLALPMTGCSGTASLPRRAGESIPTASCVVPRQLAPAPLPGELGVYRAGPLMLAVGDDLAQHPEEWPGRRTSGSEAIAVLSGSRPVVLSVDRASRDRFSLRFTPTGRGHPSPVLSDGRAAVRFPACSARRHRFGLGAVFFKGRGCARLHVEQRGRPAVAMLIPIGNTLRGCRSSEPMQRLGAASTPFLGVACSGPNSIACDRVGIGVHLRRSATLVVAQIVGRLVTLSPPTDSSDDLWLGYLFDAGLRHGSLNVPIPARTHLWLGSPEVFARVRVVAFFPDGRVAARSATVLLHPGFG